MVVLLGGSGCRGMRVDGLGFVDMIDVFSDMAASTTLNTAR